MPPQSAEEKLVQRRTADAVKAALASGRPRFTGFLNEREAALATAELNRHLGCGFLFYGGYEGAERLMLCVFEDTGSSPGQFPIVPMRISVAGGDGLTHRDYLGALLGTGLERSCIGDILPDGEGAVVYIQERVAPFLADELRSIGRCNANATVLAGDSSPAAGDANANGDERTASVASLRLDAVLGAMLHCSRTEAAGLVRQGIVQVNHLLVDSLHYRVQDGDVFSVRGRGKYRLSSVGGKSRKNRVFIQYIQY